MNKIAAALFIALTMSSPLVWGYCRGPSGIHLPYPDYQIGSENAPVSAHDPSTNQSLPWTAALQSTYYGGNIEWDTCNDRRLGVDSIVWSSSPKVSGASYSDSYGTYDIYQTAVDGVGYIIRSKANVTEFHPVSGEVTVIYPNVAYNNTASHYQIKLVIYGNPKPGQYALPESLLAYWAVRSRESGNVISQTVTPVYVQAQTLSVYTIGCSVTTGASQTVVLPSVGSRAFSGIGSTASPVASFTLGLDCSPDISLYAVVSDGVNPANTSDTLTLTPDSSATGVGIQIFRSGEGTPVPLGPESSQAGTVNQWYFGTGASSYVVPFDVRYVQTQEVITPGNLTALATITFSYQ